MIATALLLFLTGLFVIANAGNFVGVFKGEKKITVFKTPTSNLGTTNTTTANAGKKRA